MLAGTMAVWLSGFVFLFCCVAMFGEPMDSASGHSDAMSEHCEKAKAARSAETSDPVFESADADSFDCCVFFATAVFDKDRRVDRFDRAALVPERRAAIRFEPVIVPERPSRLAERRPYKPDRQDTFLRNRVFLI